MENQHPGGQATPEAKPNERHIIKAIETYEKLGKYVNRLSLYVREDFDSYFPELSSLVCDDATYAKLALYISNQCDPSERDAQYLSELLDGKVENAPNAASKIEQCAKRDLSDMVLDPAIFAANSIVKMAEHRRELHSTLREEMLKIAPNLTELVGEVIAAQFIQKAGSMNSLIRFPGSKLQILGAERTLAKALKTGRNTPKHGLIYNSIQVQQVAPKHRGRMARTLASKCILAAREDYFTKDKSADYGRTLREQIEKKCRSWATEGKSQKNIVEVRFQNSIWDWTCQC
ncbi:Nop domain-containing protein [Xylariaceae sp. AK1471]|nr:Nop domain-containing protein [Xylariaceae sp. AK1471]